MNDIETPQDRNTRLNFEAANFAHAEGRHGVGASLDDRRGWAALGCVVCKAGLV